MVEEVSAAESGFEKLRLKAKEERNEILYSFTVCFEALLNLAYLQRRFTICSPTTIQILKLLKSQLRV